MNNNQLRIVQLIDSLDAGGAERMAVNYADVLMSEIAFSGLVVTRKEGLLKSQLKSEISYLFLNRKRILDFFAIIKFLKFLNKNNINWIHAHSSSIFFAVMIKFLKPSIKIIWHDHFGQSEFLDTRKYFFLKIANYFVNRNIVVNQQLLHWHKKKFTKHDIYYLPNFVQLSKLIPSTTVLKGTIGKRIVCLANLRPQKNHFLIIEAAKLLRKSNPDWTFHLIGQDFEDDYSSSVQNVIKENNLEDTIFLYGSRKDILPILKQAAIGILTSNSEGLPLALLEYGSCSLPVIATKVGEIPNIIKHEDNGLLIMPGDVKHFYEMLVKLINDKLLSNNLGNKLHFDILNNMSEAAIIKQYLLLLK